MQQTLLALLAMLIVAFLSFSQMQASMQNQRQAIQTEYSQMALGVARQVVEIVQAQEFEGGDPQDDCLDGWDALENCGNKMWHFHTDETSIMDSSDNILPARTPDRSFPFQVEIEIHHAILNNDVSKNDVNVERTSNENESDYKEIRVRVQDCQEGDPSDNNPCDGDSFLTQPIVLTEIAGDTE